MDAKKYFGPTRLYPLLSYVLFFIAFLLYTIFFIKPDHYAAWKGTAFICNAHFFQSGLTHPGGITEYIAVFFDQFFAVRWIGSITLTVIAFGITLSIHGVFKILDIKNSILHFVPAVCFITLLGNYHFMVEHNLAILFAVVALYIYLLIPLGNASRVLILAAMSIILYYLIAAPVVIFVLSAVVIEIIKKKNYFSVLALVIAGLLPLLSTLLFAERAVHPYFYLLPIGKGYTWRFFSYFVIFALPLILVLNLLLKKTLKWMVPAQIAVLILVAVWLGLTSQDKNLHRLMDINKMAQEHYWQQIIDDVKKNGRPAKRLANFQVARALFYSNNLLDNYLNFIHPARSVDSYWMVKDEAFSAPMEQSDFCLELGIINEAEHWAHEALSLQSHSLRAFERLVQTGLLRDNIEYARLHYNLLKSSPVGKKIAKKYQPYIEGNAPINRDPFLHAIQKRSINKDYQIHDYKATHTLKHILEISPSNKMAFDYMMLNMLLNGKLEDLWENRYTFKKFGYTIYPQLVDQAYLLYAIGQKISPQELRTLGVQLSTLNTFKAYNQVLKKYNGNASAARYELHASFRNTYWYYIMFTLVDHIKEKTQDN